MDIFADTLIKVSTTHSIAKFIAFQIEDFVHEMYPCDTKSYNEKVLMLSRNLKRNEVIKNIAYCKESFSFYIIMMIRPSKEIFFKEFVLLMFLLACRLNS